MAPLNIDREDFPTMARTGLHSGAELDQTRSIFSPIPGSGMTRQ
jgi:hypothetical protein